MHFEACERIPYTVYRRAPYYRSVFSNTYYNAELPGEIAIGREYAEAMPVYDHEINHALQNSRNTTLDDLLTKYFNNSI